MRVALALLCLLLGGLAQAQTPDPAARASEEKAAQQKLAAVREQIRSVTAAQHATSGERNEATKALREQEMAVAGVLTDIRTLDEQRLEQQAALDALHAQQKTLQVGLAEQREGLAALLRSAYALGRDQELKLLLQQEDIAASARVLSYHRYFQQAQVQRIDALLAALQQLVQVGEEIEGKQAQLDATRAQHELEIEQLQQQRAQREQLLAEIEHTLKDQRAHLAAMGRDEAGILKLLEQLQDVFADIPDELAGAARFASQRGRLVHPHPGKLRTAFGAKDGAGRVLSGWLIEAAQGDPVQAVAGGRVAFADWLKGYGLLLILDHGDGYMSLYGYNDSLLRDVGEWVAAGDRIASSGATGGHTTPALYFELRHKGKPINPKPWLR